MEIFSVLLDIISSNREITYWRKWLKDEKSEELEMPLKLTEFQLLVIKTLRLDHITSAITSYIGENTGDKYIESTFDMNVTLKETSFPTPIFFILLPGKDPSKNVEELSTIIDKSIER